MRAEVENNVENHKPIWEIKGMTCLIGFVRPHTTGISRWIGCSTCHTRNGILTRTQYSLKSKFLMRIYHILCIPLFLVIKSTITSEHKVKSSLSIAACNNQELTPSTTYTDYCITQVLHHRKIDCLPRSASLSSLCGPSSAKGLLISGSLLECLRGCWVQP